LKAKIQEMGEKRSCSVPQRRVKERKFGPSKEKKNKKGKKAVITDLPGGRKKRRLGAPQRMRQKTGKGGKKKLERYGQRNGEEVKTQEVNLGYFATRAGQHHVNTKKKRPTLKTEELKEEIARQRKSDHGPTHKPAGKKEPTSPAEGKKYLYGD